MFTLLTWRSRNWLWKGPSFGRLKSMISKDREEIFSVTNMSVKSIESWLAGGNRLNVMLSKLRLSMEKRFSGANFGCWPN